MLIHHYFTCNFQNITMNNSSLWFRTDTSTCRRCKVCKKGVKNNSHFIKCPTIDVEWMVDVPEDRRFQLGRDVLRCFREVIGRSPPLRNEEVTSWDISRAFKATLDEAHENTFDKEWWINYEHVVSVALRRLAFTPIPPPEKRAVSFVDADFIDKTVADDDESDNEGQRHISTFPGPRLDNIDEEGADQISVVNTHSGESRVESVVGGSQTARALKRPRPSTPSEVIKKKKAIINEDGHFVQVIAHANDKAVILDILREKWARDKDMANIGLEKTKEDIRKAEAEARKAEAEARKAEAEKDGILAKTEQMRIQMEMKTKSTTKLPTSSLTLFALLRDRQVTMDVARWAIRNADRLPNTKLRHIAAPTKNGLTRGLTTDIVFEGDDNEDKVAKQLIDMAASEVNNGQTPARQHTEGRKTYPVKLKSALQNAKYPTTRLDEAATLLRRVEPDEIKSTMAKNGSGLPIDYITNELETRLTELLPREWSYVNLQDYLRSLGVAETDVQRLANYAFHSKHNTNRNIIVPCGSQKKSSDYQFVGSDIDKVRREILLNIAELRALIEQDYERPRQADEQRQFIEPSTGNSMKGENTDSSVHQPLHQTPVSTAPRRPLYPAHYFAKRCADIVTLPAGKIMAMTDILKEAGVFKALRKMGVAFTPLPIVRDVARTIRLMGQRGVDHDNHRALYSTDDFAVIMDAVDVVCGQHFPLVFETD